MKTEWKVPMQSLRALFSPTIVPILSFISAAAFFVKVNASILSGEQPFASAYAILPVRTLVLPAPAPATISTGPSMLVTALSWASSRPAVNAPILFSIMKRNYEKNG